MRKHKQSSIFRDEIIIVDAGTFQIDQTRISSCSLYHPQESVAYKFERGSKHMVFSTETEHPERGIDQKLSAFVQGAALLVCDAAFRHSDQHIDGIISLSGEKFPATYGARECSS